MTEESAAQKMLSQVRNFAQGPMSDASSDWSMGTQPDPLLTSQAAQIGLTGVALSRSHGGKGFGFDVLTAVYGQLASVDFGFAMSLVNTHNVGVRLSVSASDKIRDTYLPKILSGEISACTALTEPTAGSDIAALLTTAHKTSRGWMLNGEKTWIINARHASVAIVFAQCTAPGEAAGIGAFVVDLTARGVRRYPIDSGFSQSTLGTGGFYLDNVELSFDAQILQPDTAFKTILTDINAARTYVAVMCNEMLRAALLEATEYGEHRHTFGKPLNAHESWAAALAHAQSDLEQSTETTSKAVSQIVKAEDAQLAAAQAKIEAVETCQRHLPALLHAMGAEGLRTQYCFARHLGAVQSAGLTDGATNILKQRVARLTQPPRRES